VNKDEYITTEATYKSCDDDDDDISLFIFCEIEEISDNGA